MNYVRCLLAVSAIFAGVVSSNAATFTVINTNNTGTGSLRWAITNAMASTAPRVVDFNIPGPGPHTIKVVAAYPFITNVISILGDTQPGYSNTPLIHILGPSTEPVFDFGLMIQVGGGATIRALRISGFNANEYSCGINISDSTTVQACVIDQNRDGIVITTFGSLSTIGGTSVSNRNIIINNTENGISSYRSAIIRGNFIGVNADGLTPAGNGHNGVRLWFADGSTIQGGTNYPQVISGNAAAGILCGPNLSHVEFSDNNAILGNFIGTDITGMISVSNQVGVHIWGGSRNRVGGNTPGDRNIISGNTADGVLIQGIPFLGQKGTNNVVSGNYIGLAADGETVLPNYYGVHIQDAELNTVGGLSAGEGNIFGAATFYNVLIQSVFHYAQSNAVYRNRFGISFTSQLLASGGAGVHIGNSSNNLIGGNSTAARNYFGGANTGVSIEGSKSRGNRVQGNYIGVAPDGTARPNNSYGVRISNASDNQIGGAYTNEGNVISGNNFYGVILQSTGTFANVVEGNIIGLNPAATLVVSNRFAGVDVSGGAFSNRIGGTDFETMNVICGNGGSGVTIRDTNSYANLVSYNFIGMTRFPAFLPIPNKSFGVDVFQSPGNAIGLGNYIGNHPSAGITIRGTSSVHNLVGGNIVGQDLFGVAHPNQGGIDVNDAANTIVGGTEALARNYVSGNINAGITIRGLATNVQVLGNVVGISVGLSTAVPNGGDGIDIQATDAIIGGTNIGARNFVGGNNRNGIYVRETATNAVIVGNYIGIAPDGSTAISNFSQGISAYAPGLVIGGITTNHRNIVSGNRGNGVELYTGAHNAVVQGNYIGLNAAGTVAVSNHQYGIYIFNADNAIIGGVGAARNIVSASRLNGIAVAGSSSNTIIAGNYIGTTVNGMARLGNGTAGIGVDADHTLIGQAISGLGNVIAGNGNVGIEVTTGSNVRIVGNLIGLGADGMTNIPNARGIDLRAGARNVLVGGTNALSRNIIARNTGVEIGVAGPSGGHLIQGNVIGVMEFGMAFPTVNFGAGIDLFNSPSNWILGNIIGQVSDGIAIRDTGSFHNVVQGNFIGEYNLEPIGSSSWGINIQGAPGNRIGGLSQPERNLIAHNAGGVLVTNSTAINNRLASNLIFSNSPRLNIDLGQPGFNTNDLHDADEGPNRLQNRPVLLGGITTLGGIVYAQGTLHSTPETQFAVDIYRSGGTSAEGRLYLGRTYAETDAGGDASFTAGFPFNLATGVFLTATATDPDDNTSEFAVATVGLVSAAAVDTDNDGIPDFWESLYGLNPAVSNAPASDLDNDGFSDWEEYIADTAANDDSKYPVITELANSANRLISFPSSSLRVYSLQYNEDLTGAQTWAQVGGSVTGLFGYTTMTDTNLPDWRNYRVGVRLP